MKEQTQRRAPRCTFPDDNMNTADLIKIGVPAGDALKMAHSHMRRLFARGLNREQVEAEFARIIAAPEKFLAAPDAAELARVLTRPRFQPRETPAPWWQWGTGLEPDAVKQIANACALPVAVAGALMPMGTSVMVCRSAAYSQPIMLSFRTRSAWILPAG